MLFNQSASFNLARSLGYVVNLTARRFEQALRKEIARHGVQPAQFGALIILWKEGPLSQTALSERLSIEQPTMANTLRRMVRDGLVEHRPCLEDRRITRYLLTPKAEALLPALVQSATAVNARAVTGLTDVECDTLFTLLARVVQALDHPHHGGQDDGTISPD